MAKFLTSRDNFQCAIYPGTGYPCYKCPYPGISSGYESLQIPPAARPGVGGATLKGAIIPNTKIT